MPSAVLGSSPVSFCQQEALPSWLLVVAVPRRVALTTYGERTLDDRSWDAGLVLVWIFFRCGRRLRNPPGPCEIRALSRALMEAR